MTRRFFNIKEGKPNVWGAMVVVDTDVPLEDRITSMYAGYHVNFKHVSIDGETEIYAMTIQNMKYVNSPVRDTLGGITYTPFPIEEGKPNVAKLSVDTKGILKLYKEGTKKIFIYEVTKKVAKEGAESAALWDLQRAYIFE